MVIMQQSSCNNNRSAIPVSLNANNINMSMKMEEKNRESFPVGMRVLAVDDDPVCLWFLENLLRRCHYQVTTCCQATKALTLLRERKEKFDLVISDVRMPDMDGFKLLELVVLEMDLPVIMISAFDEKSSVMKGITHGACDYLLKPIRIEELKNIWQHVVRKKWNETKDHDHSGPPDENDKPKQGTEDGEFGSSANGGIVGTFHKKRKEQKDDNDDENGHKNEDSSTLKKARVVWSDELHREFVRAVNKLGIDKAVPKKIMDLMNVQGLTRENVASHLQKYRLYWKKNSGVGNHPGDLGGKFTGGRELSFASLGSVNGFSDLQKLATSGQSTGQGLAILRGGIVGSLNSSGGMGIVGPRSSGMLQLDALQGSKNSIIGREQIALYPMNNQCNSFPSLPTELGLEQLHQKQQISRFQNIETTMSESAQLHSSQYLLTAGNGLDGVDSAGVDKGNLTIKTANNAMLLQIMHQQQQQQHGGLVNLDMAGTVNQNPAASDSSGVSASGLNDCCGDSVHLSNTSGFSGSWNCEALSGFPPSIWKSCTAQCDGDSSGKILLETLLGDSNDDCQSMDILPDSSGGSTVTVPMSMCASGPSLTAVSEPAYDLVTREDLSLSNVSAIGANMRATTDCVPSDNNNFKFPFQASLNIELQQGMNQITEQGWHGHRWELGHISKPSLTQVSEVTYGAQPQSWTPVHSGQSMNSAFRPLVDSDVPLLNRERGMERSTAGSQLRLREDQPLEPTKVESTILPQNSIRMDELLNSLLEQQHKGNADADGDVM